VVKILLGKKLKYNDTIGVISPAGPETMEFICEHIDILRGMGFKVKEAEHLYDRQGYLAGSDLDRANDLMNMFKDSEVDVIICFRGGYGTMRILPLIDYNIIINNPKIFVGYSDITTLLNYFSQKCGLITFHGPMVNSNLEDKYTFKSLMKNLMLGNEPYCITNPPESPFLFHGINSPVIGPLVGGNLTLLCSTLGTDYEIDTEGKILFIEEIGEEPYKIDRMLTQLLLAQKLQKCRGFILGQFTSCDTSNFERSLSLSQVIEDRLLTLSKPTLMNFMSGHDYPKLTLPISANICLDPCSNEIKVLEAVVR
jgi:muramoyltetrapeptide carboxypeptidase